MARASSRRSSAARLKSFSCATSIGVHGCSICSTNMHGTELPIRSAGQEAHDTMQILDLPEIRRALDYREVIGHMRDALIAFSRGECDTPMPMHLDIADRRAEVHM